MSQKIQVINYDRDGKVIEDLAKVKLPTEFQKKILSLLDRGDVYVGADKGGTS